MKKLLCIGLFYAALMAHGQVGIGTANPTLGAMLDVSSTNKGFLPPRLTTLQRDNINPKPEGLLIYNTDENCMQYWNGSKWIGNCTGTFSANPIINTNIDSKHTKTEKK